MSSSKTKKGKKINGPDHRAAFDSINYQPSEQNKDASCWAVSLINYVELLVSIKIGQPCPRLSYQELLDCFTPPIRSKYKVYCEDGGNPVDACFFLRDTGIVPDKFYPNSVVRPFDEILRVRSELDIPREAWTRPIHGLTVFCKENNQDLNGIATLQEIRNLADKKPILLGFDVGEDFYESMLNSWKIYRPPKDGERHGQLMVVVGYHLARNESEKSYWIVLNTFGKDWGKNEYGRVLMSPDRNPITLAVAFDIKKDWTVPSEWHF